MTRIAVPLLVIAFASGAAAQPPGLKPPLPQETVLRAQDTLRSLGFELTMLETDVLPTIKDPGYREALVTRTNQVQISASNLERGLLPGGKGFGLHKRYSQLDQDLHNLIETIDSSPARTLSLAQTSRRLGFLDTQLGSFFGGHGEEAGEVFPVVLRRQANGLYEAGNDLFELSRTVIPGDANGLRVRESVRKFKVAAGVFSDRLDHEDSVPSLRKAYSIADRAWQRVAYDINRLPPTQGNRLAAAAQRVDHLHGRLVEMLKIEDSGQYIIQEGNDQIRDLISQIQGTWFIDRYFLNGAPQSGIDPGNKMIFAGSRWFRYEKGAVSGSGTFRILEVDPKFMKLELTSNDGNTTPVLVSIDGNIMRYAHFTGRAAFPGTFQPRPGDQMLSIIWRRE